VPDRDGAALSFRPRCRARREAEGDPRAGSGACRRISCAGSIWLAAARAAIWPSENPASTTESYIALKAHISNWRWKGTPFYLRTGKRLRARASEIAITFKEPPHSIFDDAEGWRENVLVIRLQPNEGMNLMVMIKEPGPGGMRLMQVPLDMSFAEALGDAHDDVPDAYERLIMDVIRGNQTLFMRGDEVEAAWAWTDPIIEGWEARGDRPQPYDPGTSGPEDALMLMHRDGRRWREIRE
jgi:glucose-6-phosphate 1-dehydrogenase